MDYIKERFHGRAPWVFERLKAFHGKNLWHNLESVYEHTNRVLEVLESFLIGIALPRAEEEVLREAALYHDVGKIEPSLGEGRIDYPGHEKISARIYYETKIAQLSQHCSPRQDGLKFGLQSQERVYDLIMHHTVIHKIMGKEEFLGPLEELTNTIQNLADKKSFQRDLVILGYSDILASDFVRIDPIEFTRRVTRYVLTLNKLL